MIKIDPGAIGFTSGFSQDSVSISLSFENQGINPVGGSSKVPRTYTNKLRTRNQRNKGVVNPFTATCESEI